MKKFFLVAGEVSGDRLGAGLITELKKVYPNAQFRGLGGELMQKAGLHSLFDVKEISHMGLTEIIKHLPTILTRRKELTKDALLWQPDAMVGIDSPDFNLAIEYKLRKAGIKTLHYVSPSVWAWRQGRVKKISASVDKILALLPFEADFYKQHSVEVKFVGHPLADSISVFPDKLQAKLDLGYKAEDLLVALLPGSRIGELERHGELFLQAADQFSKKMRMAYTRKNLVFIIPTVAQAFEQKLAAIAKNYPGLKVEILGANTSTQALTAADLALVASGTATLEAMLTKTPMVVAYKVSSISHFILKRMIKVGFASLPNLLAGKALVRERLQGAAKAETLASDLFKFIENPKKATELQEKFKHLHYVLQKNADQGAKDAVVSLLEKT